MALIDRFTGPEGERSLREAVRCAKLVQGNDGLTDALLRAGQVVAAAAGSTLIEQGGDDNDVYVIVAGACDIIVNGRTVGRRGPGDHVGEMAEIEPAQPRSASVIAANEVVLLRVRTH